MEQDAGLLHRMVYLGRVFESVQRVRSLSGEQIHHMNPADAGLLGSLQEQGFI